jgi:molecular chaperone DnaK (HSP70)
MVLSAKYVCFTEVKRLIVRRFSEHCVQNDITRWPFIVVAGLNDHPTIIVHYEGKERWFAHEQILAMVLIKLKETVEASLGRTVKNVVITPLGRPLAGPSRMLPSLCQHISTTPSDRPP